MNKRKLRWIAVALFVLVLIFGACKLPSILVYYGVLPVSLNSISLPDGSPIAKVDNPAAVDVSEAALLSFLSFCETQNKKYILGEYVCTNFAQDLHNEAEDQGIRAAIVILGSGGSRHAFVAFQVEGGEIVRVEMGEGFIIITPISSLNEAVSIHW